MRQKTSIDTAELVRLKTEKGLSLQALAIFFKVSRWTIQRRLWEATEEKKDPEVMSYATQLERFARSAPNAVVKKEMLRMVLTLRTRHAISTESKKRLILGSIASGAREVEEIAEECEMRREECFDLLEILAAENRLVKRASGGAQSRGRKKIHYHILHTEKIKPFPPVKSCLEVTACAA